MYPKMRLSIDGHSFSLCSTLCLCKSFHGYFVPPSKKDQSIYTWSSFFLSLWAGEMAQPLKARFTTKNIRIIFFAVLMYNLMYKEKKMRNA
jgi:hypothetical protein